MVPSNIHITNKRRCDTKQKQKMIIKVKKNVSCHGKVHKDQIVKQEEVQSLTIGKEKVKTKNIPNDDDIDVDDFFNNENNDIQLLSEQEKLFNTSCETSNNRDNHNVLDDDSEDKIKVKAQKVKVFNSEMEPLSERFRTHDDDNYIVSNQRKRNLRLKNRDLKLESSSATVRKRKSISKEDDDNDSVKNDKDNFQVKGKVIKSFTPIVTPMKAIIATDDNYSFIPRNRLNNVKVETVASSTKAKLKAEASETRMRTRVIPHETVESSTLTTLKTEAQEKRKNARIIPYDDVTKENRNKNNTLKLEETKSSTSTQVNASKKKKCIIDNYILDNGNNYKQSQEEDLSSAPETIKANQMTDDDDLDRGKKNHPLKLESVKSKSQGKSKYMVGVKDTKNKSMQTGTMSSSNHELSHPQSFEDENETKQESEELKAEDITNDALPGMTTMSDSTHSNSHNGYHVNQNESVSEQCPYIRRERCPRVLTRGYTGKLNDSSLSRSVGVTRAQLNRHLTELGLTAKFNVPVVSSHGCNISHLCLNESWNNLPQTVDETLEFWLGEGSGRFALARPLKPKFQHQVAIPIFWAKKAKGFGGALCYYIGHFRCVQFIELKKHIVFKRKPRQALIELSFERFDICLNEKLSIISTTPADLIELSTIGTWEPGEDDSHCPSPPAQSSAGVVQSAALSSRNLPPICNINIVSNSPSDVTQVDTNSASVPRRSTKIKARVARSASTEVSNDVSPTRIASASTTEESHNIAPIITSSASTPGTRVFNHIPSTTNSTIVTSSASANTNQKVDNNSTSLPRRSTRIKARVARSASTEVSNDISPTRIASASTTEESHNIAPIITSSASTSGTRVFNHIPSTTSSTMVTSSAIGNTHQKVDNNFKSLPPQSTRSKARVARSASTEVSNDSSIMSAASDSGREGSYYSPSIISTYTLQWSGVVPHYPHWEQQVQSTQIPSPPHVPPPPPLPPLQLSGISQHNQYLEQQMSSVQIQSSFDPPPLAPLLPPPPPPLSSSSSPPPLQWLRFLDTIYTWSKKSSVEIQSSLDPPPLAPLLPPPPPSPSSSSPPPLQWLRFLDTIYTRSKKSSVQIQPSLDPPP